MNLHLATVAVFVSLITSFLFGYLVGVIRGHRLAVSRINKMITTAKETQSR